MAQVKKLQIQGIRSFSPDTNSAQTIEFYSPLTLIVGQNGCGKTTVIEALKFALTNEYPPGTIKGGSFVHDPKLSSGYEVPAMVKLELLDRNRDKIIMTRRLKATQKGNKGNITVASVEASIRRIMNTGEIKDMSSKCADVKNEMARLMGVSEAILSHVILCHQEDSCWPLDEGKKVKEKFDAIFNTEMYMKALKRLADKDKAMAADIKLWEKTYEFTQTRVQEMKDKQNQVETLTAELKSITSTCDKKKQQAEELERKVRALAALEDDYGKICAQLEYQKKLVADGEEFITKQTSIIGRVMEGSVADLKREIENFEGRKGTVERKLRVFERDEKDKLNELENLNKKRAEINQEAGKLAQAEHENFQAKSSIKMLTGKVAKLMRAMKDNSQETNFTTTANDFLEAYEGDESSEHKPEIVIKAITSALNTRQMEEKKLLAEYEVQEKELQAKIDRQRESIASTETEIEMKRKDTEQNNKLLNELRKKLSSLEGSGEALAMLEDDIEQNESTIESITSSGIIGKCEQEIQKLQIEIKGLQQKKEKVKQELDLLRQDKIIADKIQILSKQRMEKQNACKEILSRSGDQIKDTLGNIPENDLASALDAKIRTLNHEIMAKEKQQKLKVRELTSHESELQHVVKELSRKERKLEDAKTKAIELLEGNSFDDVYEETTTKLSEAQKENYFNEANQYLFRKYTDQLKAKNCCPLCKRDFKTKKENTELLQSIQNDVEKLRRGQPEEKQKVERLEEQNKALSEFKPVWEEMKRLEDEEIPELERRKNTLEMDIENLTEESQGFTDSIELMKTELSTANGLKRDAVIYDQHKKDTQKLDNEIKRCERERNPDVKDCTMTLSDAEEDMESIEGNIATKQLDKENKETTKTRKEKELAKAESERNAAVKQKLELQSAMQNRDVYETEKKKLENSNKTLSGAIDVLLKKLPIAKAEISKLQAKKLEVKQDHDSKISGLRKEAAELDKCKDSLVVLKRQLERFEDQKRAFEANKEQLIEFNSKLDECESSLKNLKKQIEELRVEVSSSETKMQALNISVMIKEKEIELESTRKEMEACEEAVAASRSRGVGSEKRKLLDELATLQSQRNRLVGQMEEKRSNLASIKAELVAKDKPYHDAEVKFKESLVRKTVYEKTKKDMRIYRAALEHAVLSFHHKKMETINKYLKCFWKKVYRGNDVDYIQIKTDNEDPSTTTSDVVKIDLTKNKRRTYNYRVVMVRRGIEQDMRGHCSAGQKILAAILIRLALAQTFSCKCGLITLDEPTTNLDKSNVNSLAETLSDLALDMRDTKTFQLVVITHDQDFIEKLLRVDPVDYYYKVSRNQNGHSQIERIPKPSF